MPMLSNSIWSSSLSLSHLDRRLGRKEALSWCGKYSDLSVVANGGYFPPVKGVLLGKRSELKPVDDDLLIREFCMFCIIAAG